MKGMKAGSVGANVGRGTRGGMVAAACVIACALQLVATAAAAAAATATATEIHLTRGAASHPPAKAARAPPQVLRRRARGGRARRQYAGFYPASCGIKQPCAEALDNFCTGAVQTNEPSCKAGCDANTASCACDTRGKSCSCDGCDYMGGVQCINHSPSYTRGKTRARTHTRTHAHTHTRTHAQ